MHTSNYMEYKSIIYCYRGIPRLRPGFDSKWSLTEPKTMC